MPFKPSNSFDSDRLKMLQTAFDEACQWLTAADGFEADDETRKALALRLVDCAKRGECDLGKLKAYALAGVTDHERCTAFWDSASCWDIADRPNG